MNLFSYLLLKLFVFVFVSVAAPVLYACSYFGSSITHSFWSGRTAGVVETESDDFQKSVAMTTRLRAVQASPGGGAGDDIGIGHTDWLHASKFVSSVVKANAAVHLLNYALCGVTDLDQTFSDNAMQLGSLADKGAARAEQQLKASFHSTSKRVCCYLFKVGDLAFNCAQCQAHTTCVLCEKCFRNSNHDGHDVTFFRVSSTGGCCDCGDTEAWKPEGFCATHGKVLALTDIFPDPRFVVLRSLWLTFGNATSCLTT